VGKLSLRSHGGQCMPSTVFNTNKVPQGLGLNCGYRAGVFTGTGTVLDSHTLGYTVPFLTVCRFYHSVCAGKSVLNVQFLACTLSHR